MKNYIFPLLLLLFCGTSCDDENERIDPTVLPEATTTGKRTFGCLVDGWIYSGARFEKINFVHQRDSIFVDVRVSRDLRLRFRFKAPAEEQKLTYIKTFLGNTEMEDGEVTITRFDTKEKIISGQFKGGKISHGRFDVPFISQEYTYD